MMLADTNDMKESLQRETEQSETQNSLPEHYETIYKVLQKQLSWWVIKYATHLWGTLILVGKNTQNSSDGCHQKNPILQ